MRFTSDMHEIEDAFSAFEALVQILLAFGGCARAEKLFEDGARIRFGRERQGFGRPGDVVLVSAGIAGVAGTVKTRSFHAELQRIEPREVADLPRGDLIDGNAEVQSGAERFPGVTAGEERRAGAGMVAGTVAPVVGGVVREIRDDLKLVLELGFIGSKVSFIS